MKHKIILFFIGMLFYSNLFCQEDYEVINLNMLAAPATPASIMLGISSSEVDKPRDPNEFLFSIWNSTSGLSRLPSSYALEVAPAWVFAKKKISYNEFISDSIKHTLWQSLTFSAGVNSNLLVPDTTQGQFTQVSLAAKVSILRGGRLRKDIQEKIETAQSYHDKIHEDLLDFLAKDGYYASLTERVLEEEDTVKLKSLNDSLEGRRKYLYSELNFAKKEAKEKFAAINMLMKDIRYDRIGWKLDLAVGMVYDFPGNIYSGNRVSRAGGWLSGGYEAKGGLSFLGLARVLFNPDLAYSDIDGKLYNGDISTFDAGLRFIYAPVDKKFLFSMEGIYRNSSDRVNLPANWRFTINSEYKFQPNMSLTFAFGRDFDGVISKEGNVIAFLNLFAGFGNEKSIKRKE